MSNNIDLHARIQRLERSQRQFWIIGVLAAGIWFCQSAFACVHRDDPRASSPDSPSALAVSSLDVASAQGEVVVHLGARSSGAGGLWLTNERGIRILKLNQNERGGLITVLDSRGTLLGTLGVDDRGQISLSQ